MERQQNKMLNYIVQSLLALVMSYLFYEVATFGKDISAMRASQFGNQEGLKVWQAIADLKTRVEQIDARGSEAFREYVKTMREDNDKREKKFEDHLLRMDSKLTQLVETMNRHIIKEEGRP